MLWRDRIVPRALRRTETFLTVLLPFLALIMTDCAHTRGPELAVNSHIDYNKAVSQVLKEELLLNIVRRRYGEFKDLSKLLAIRYSERVPESAFQMVRYRDLWFYIDDRDLHSKAGFNALYDLWQLSVKAPSDQSQPVTTIQVN